MGPTQMQEWGAEGSSGHCGEWALNTVGTYVSVNAALRFLYDFYHYFYLLTNTLFYVSSAINPLLYNLVSATFRQAFMTTLGCLCWPRGRRRAGLARMANSVSSSHTCSSNVTRETLS